jgi:hypothetical protein
LRRGQRGAVGNARRFAQVMTEVAFATAIDTLAVAAV